MYSISRIQQVLKAVPQGAFDKIVQGHGGDRYVKRFRCRDQLVAMLYMQLAGAQSLRELQAGFNAQTRHHYHLGTARVARSTLSEANERRNPLIFAELLKLLIEQAGRALRRERSELLYLLDATTVPLPPRCSQELRGHMSKRGNHGMKLHLQFEADSAAVASASITKAAVNDITEGRKLPIEAGATYVFDKGYCNYNWWHSIDQKGATFVTRFRRDAALTFKRERRASKKKGILRDSIVAFALRTPRGGHRNSYSTPLRRIEVHCPDQAPLVLATNDLTSPAEEIALLYKQRWAIELLFKWVKQHLQIRRFVGRNENAMRIQLLTALIAYMLVLLLKKASGFPGTLWMLLAELRHSLFQRPRTDESYCRRRRALQEYIATVQPCLFT
ncbi:MAG TPA: IS4 family transposase [Ramlibacter sp.]|nr:IS4 family transposase [Ramlibacter sp.]